MTAAALTAAAAVLLFPSYGGAQEAADFSAGGRENAELSSVTRESASRLSSTQLNSDVSSAPLGVTMLDVGQGLCLLLESDGHYAVYDGGNREHSSRVVSAIQNLGITDLDLMITSHYDEDHIAGLIGLLNTENIGTVLTPDYTADAEIYYSFRDHLADSGAQEVHPSVGDEYQLGSALIRVLGPETYDSEIENDRSIAVKAVDGSFSVIITGDAEFGEEEEMISSGYDLSADVLVVGHHGSRYSTGDAFLQAVSPSSALISVGEENDYGHPSQEVLDRLAGRGIRIYRTDELGDISVVSDGSTYNISSDEGKREKEPGSYDAADGRSGSRESADTAGTAAAADGVASAGTEAGADYIGNANTFRFHYPDCPSVERMNESNKVYFTGKTRDEIIALGYEPCKNCSP